MCRFFSQLVVGMSRIGTSFSVSLLIVAPMFSVQAQTWDDAQGNPQWSKSQNWVGRQTPSNDGQADVFFGIGIHPGIFINQAWNIRSLTFLSDSGAYRFYGAALTIQGGGINNFGAPTQFFTNTLALGQNQTWNQAGGDITSYGTVSLGSATLTIDGAKNLSLFGPVTGSGSLFKQGSGVLSLSGTNSFTGGIIATQGVLEFGNNRAAGYGDIRFNNATLRASINGLTLTNRFFLSGTATVAGPNSITLAGNVVLTADQTIDVLNTGSITIRGQVQESGGVRSLRKIGAGILDLAGSSDFSGTTTVDAGTLTVSGNDALAMTSGVQVNSSATFNLGGIDPINRVRDGAMLTLSGGNLVANSHTETFGRLTLEQNSKIVLSPGGLAGTLVFADALRIGGTLTIDGWTGNAGQPGTDDRIIFTTAPGNDFLQNVLFSGYSPGATLLPTGEIVPVPEPGPLALLAVGISAFCFRSLRRQLRFRRPA